MLGPCWAYLDLVTHQGYHGGMEKQSIPMQLIAIDVLKPTCNMHSVELKHQDCVYGVRSTP